MSSVLCCYYCVQRIYLCHCFSLCFTLYFLFNDSITLCVVFQVSEEVGLTSTDDDVDLDLDEDVTVDMKVPLKLPAAECDVADEVAAKTHLPTASNVDCHDTSTVISNPGSNDQQHHKVTVEATNEANCKSDEFLSQTVSQVADLSSQMTRNIPGKALLVQNADSELPMVDNKPQDSLSGPLDTTKFQSESARSSGLASSDVAVVDSCASDIKSKNSQFQSKKCDNKSVSMTMCDFY